MRHETEQRILAAMNEGKIPIHRARARLDWEENAERLRQSDGVSAWRRTVNAIRRWFGQARHEAE
jgi:hypothetical protein